MKLIVMRNINVIVDVLMKPGHLSPVDLHATGPGLNNRMLAIELNNTKHYEFTLSK